MKGISGLPRLLRTYARRYGPKPVIKERRKEGFAEYTWLDLWKGAVEVGERLLAAGLPLQAPVFVVGPFSAATVVAEFGVMLGGGLAIPLEPSGKNLEFQGVEVWGALVKEGLEGTFPADVLKTSFGEPPKDTSVEEPVSRALEERIEWCGPNSLILALWSRGTSGRRKLVDLTNENICSACLGLSNLVKPSLEDRWLAPTSALTPLERVAGLYTGLISGGEVCIVGDEGSDPLERFWLARPSIAFCEASQLDVIAGRVLEEVAGMKGLDGAMARFALRAAKVEGLGRVRLPEALRRHIWSLCAERLLQVLGGALRVIVAGFGQVSEMANRVCQAMGIKVLVTYGLAEASGIVAVGEWGAGLQPIEGAQVFVTKEGEIVVSGPNIMFSYHGVTRDKCKVFLGERLLTGDLGHLDEKGSLTFLRRAWG